jgi:hypothetical protein
MIYMHKYIVAIFPKRYLIPIYTCIVNLYIFLPFSPTVIYSLYLFYINSKFTQLKIFEFIKHQIIYL